jgi:hypothetical protein
VVLVTAVVGVIGDIFVVVGVVVVETEDVIVNVDVPVEIDAFVVVEGVFNLEEVSGDEHPTRLNANKTVTETTHSLFCLIFI